MSTRTTRWSFPSALTCMLLPMSLALGGPKGAAGDLYVTSATNEIIQFDGDTGELVGTFVDIGLSDPRHLAFGPNGNLFVSNEPGYVREYDGSTGELVRTFAGEEIDSPSAILFTPQDTLLVSNFRQPSRNPTINEYDGLTGQMIGVFADDILVDTTSMTQSPQGQIVVGERLYHRIRRFDADGTDLGVFASGGDMTYPTGLAFGANGNLFVSSAGNNTVVEYDGVSGDLVGVFVDDERLNIVVGLAFSPSGDLHIANRDANSVLAYDGETGEFIREISGGGLQQPRGVAFKPIPPDNSLDVFPTPLRSRRLGTFMVYGARPNRAVFLLYSLSGLGATYIRPLNVVVNLDQPRLALDGHMTDADGNWRWVGRMPAVLSAIEVWFQVAQKQNVTNFIATSFIP